MVVIDNIETYTRTLLMDSSIINLTADKKVYFLHAENPTPLYCEYEFYNEDGGLWEEGKEIGTFYYLQVDIFSLSTQNYITLKNSIKKKLTDNGFNRISIVSIWEETTKLNHCAMRFNIGD